jgi:drug/metabolite transporter (DMT)-like permease
VALVLPALFYFLSNVLALLALSHLRSSVFSAIMNSRIIFVAFFSISLLHKHLNGGQWRAILILGCAATMLCLEDVKMDNNFTLHQESIGMFLAVATALISAVAGMLAETYLNADGGVVGHVVSAAVVPQQTNTKIGDGNQATPSYTENQLG